MCKDVYLVHRFPVFPWLLHSQLKRKGLVWGSKWVRCICIISDCLLKPGADIADQSWHLFLPKVDLFAKLFSIYWNWHMKCNLYAIYDTWQCFFLLLWSRFYLY